MRTMLLLDSKALLVVILLLTMPDHCQSVILDHATATELSLYDDYLHILTLPTAVRLRGTDYSNIYVSDNGLIAFDSSFTTVGSELSNLVGSNKWLAPFGSDVVESPAAELKHQTFNQGTETAVVDAYVSGVFPDASFTASVVYVITWLGVKKVADTTTATNTFQLALATDGSQTFAAFLYDTIEWYPAVVGVGGGDGSVQQVCYTNTLSAKHLPERSNSDNCGAEPGVIVFRIDDTSAWSTECKGVYTKPTTCTDQGTTHRPSVCSLRRRKKRR
ncbi:TECTA-like protein [Mya arenaria]|uniref:TECTA-like protein n=1 Tax=Mya arenaria TaxID=6604 RepID=A0ABY7FE93_MYAAR|nr:alpha-tectorin-like [Mya arenaria]WAR19086.1 TECTA-like protein [Mya arenaria]